MAEAYDIAAPHAPYGPIALAATLQVDVCSQMYLFRSRNLELYKFDLLDFNRTKYSV